MHRVGSWLDLGFRAGSRITGALGIIGAFGACGEPVVAPMNGTLVPLALAVAWPSTPAPHATFGGAIDTIEVRIPA